MIRVPTAFSLRTGGDTATAERRRNLIAISVVAFLASVGFMVIMPFLPGLLRETAGSDSAGSGLWLGLAISIAPLMTALTGPVWAALGERFGHKGMIERSVICIGIGVGLMALAASPIHVVALRALIGGLGGISVATLAAITATTPRRDLGPAVGTLQAAQTAGSMFGPLLGGFLGSIVGMRESFVLSGVIFAVALGLVHVLYRELPPLVEAPTRPARADARPAGVLSVGVVVALLVAFGAQFVEGSFMILMPIELDRLGVSDESFPMIYGAGLSVTYLAATIAAAVAGRMAQRRAAPSLLRMALVVSAIALLPMMVVTAWWQFISLRVLLALVAGACPTLAYAASASASTPENRGKVVSLTSSAGILGWAASPLAAGALISVSGSLLLALNAAIYVTLALVVLAADRGLLDRVVAALRGHHGLPSFLPTRGGPLPSLAGPRGLLERLPSRAMLLSSHTPRERFTVAEVVQALGGRSTTPRAQAVLELAAQTSRWMPSDPSRAFADVRQYADRLPTILYQYRTGEDPEVIGRRLSPFGAGWPVKRSVEIAAGLIAQELNR